MYSISNSIKVLTVIAIGVLAPCTAMAWGGYNNVTLRLLTLYQAGRGANPGALIELPAPFPSDNEGCTQSNKGYAWIDFTSATQPDGKALYASVLAAHLAGRPLGIGTNGCSVDGFPVVYGINVY